jgi:hypothetical protein
VDQTDWAADIRSNLALYECSRYEENFVSVFERVPKLIPTTFPMRKDVLIETRHGSDYLAMYNDFVGHQKPCISKPQCKEEQVHKNYPDLLREATRYIAGMLRAAFCCRVSSETDSLDVMRLLHM